MKKVLIYGGIRLQYRYPSEFIGVKMPFGFILLMFFSSFPLFANCTYDSLTPLGKGLKGVSGVAFSKKKLYWISPKEFALYTSTHMGSSWRRLRFTGARRPLNWSAEDISMSRCRKRRTENCLFIANIGRDDQISKSFKGDRYSTIFIIPEDKIGSKAFWSEIKANYPNKSRHHAEAFAIHPKTLDWYLITKRESILYKMKYAKWRHRTPGDNKKRFIGEWEKVSKLDLKKISSLDFSSDGERAILVSEGSIVFTDKNFKKFSKINIKSTIKKPSSISSYKEENSFILSSKFSNQFQKIKCSK